MFCLIMQVFSSPRMISFNFCLIFRAHATSIKFFRFRFKGIQTDFKRLHQIISSNVDKISVVHLKQFKTRLISDAVTTQIPYIFAAVSYYLLSSAYPNSFFFFFFFFNCRNYYLRSGTTL